MNRKWSRQIIVALMASVIFCASAPAEEVVEITAIADAFLSEAHASSNYGNAGGLAVSASGLPRGEFQSVVRFDAASAKADLDARYGTGQWSILAVDLTFTITSPNNPLFNAQSAGSFAVQWMHNDNWIEGSGSPSNPGTSGISFDTLPGFLDPMDEELGLFSFDEATAGALTLSLATTMQFQQDLSTGQAISLRLLAADPAISMVLNSRNFGEPPARPKMSLTVIPEPAALLPVLMVLATLAFGRRPRRIV